MFYLSHVVFISRLHASLQGSEQQGSVPNPPILTSRTSTTMTFKPAPYTPPSGVKVTETSSLVHIAIFDNQDNIEMLKQSL